MKRRNFLAAMLTAPLVTSPGLAGYAEPGNVPSEPAANAAPEWRRFQLTTHVVLPKDAGAAQLFLPLVQTAAGYQNALDLRWQGSGTTACVHDTRYGAPILRTTWESGQPTAEVEVVQTVATRDRGPTPLLPLTEAERRFWTLPGTRASGDDIVSETARRIVAGQTEPRARLRALYDWVVDHTHRDPETLGCGTGNVVRSLSSGQLGGKCADINTLMAALARAAGFPAREVYGIRLAGSRFYPSLGRNGDISKAQHCRCEVFLEDDGWFPLDPADVGKVVLEEKVTLDSAAGRELRERMFGRWEMNWAGYNSAANIELPGIGKTRPDFDFLMYPCGFTEQGPLPCLDPGRFHYEISVKELTA